MCIIWGHGNLCSDPASEIQLLEPCGECIHRSWFPKTLRSNCHTSSQDRSPDSHQQIPILECASDCNLQSFLPQHWLGWLSRGLAVVGTWSVSFHAFWFCTCLNFSINVGIHCGSSCAKCRISLHALWSRSDAWKRGSYFSSAVAPPALQLRWGRNSPGTATLTLLKDGVCIIWTSVVRRGNCKVPDVVVWACTSVTCCEPCTSTWGGSAELCQLSALGEEVSEAGCNTV